MNNADIVVAVIIVFCGIIALRLGLVRVVLGLAGWVGASLATIYGYSYTQPYSREYIGNGLIADVVAGAAIFVVTMVVLTFISHAIAGGVRGSAFGMEDNGSFYKGAKTLPLVKRGANLLASAAPAAWGLKQQSRSGASPDSNFRSLLSPKPAGAEIERKSGYKTEERVEMDRLIRSHQ